MKEIHLTQGKVTTVDDDLFDFLSQWKWHAVKNKHTWYAVAKVNGSPVLMHRVIMDAPAGVKVDHRDRNGLNNTKKNLRFATYSQNSANRKVSANNRLGYKGVYFDKRMKKYVAKVTASNKRYWLGHYSTPEDAARAYDEKAKELFGEFAGTNF